VIVGTKSGELEIYDIPSSSLIRSIQAHSGAIWNIEVSPDQQQLVTCSADKDIKFWDFDLERDENDLEVSFHFDFIFRKIKLYLKLKLIKLN